MKLVRLPQRLKTISEYIDYNDTVIDVGTDHGKLPVYLAQINPKRVIMATDISANSLKAAFLTAEKYALTKNIDFLVTSGLKNIDLSLFNTIIIAGLGGETIVEILSDIKWQKNGRKKLILQPQSKTNKLCRFLYNNHYNIIDIKTILDNKREYTIMNCSKGG
ncbi:MAG: class I SAM-dependent methyltransferase [Oscillospiraceae bacterium]|jgi:tRNA (adenine22-N1)-methyltransferase|nr:class I SAM-dependent methyltransferase [Oscillospiraceae bacterium]